jgi:inner membrane protein
MDSLTQAALGACVAHSCWHRQLGRRALLFGGIAGTIPDLDIIIYPLLNNIERLYWHRGESHSILFVVTASILLSVLLRKKTGGKMSLPRFTTGLFLIFSTHILIDYFTVYGTQILAPFSRYGFARGNMFIIDPLYTIPLIAGIITALFLKHKGCKAVYAGLVISSVYIIFSLASHNYADSFFKSHLKSKNINVIESITSATALNTLLWRHIARTDKGILVGYFSIIGNSRDEEITFDLVKRNEHLVELYKNQPNFEVVKWFSKGFYTAEIKNNDLIISDIRFGEFRSKIDDPPEKWEYFFSWELKKDPYKLISRSGGKRELKPFFSSLWKRIIGQI